MKGDKN